MKRWLFRIAVLLLLLGVPYLVLAGPALFAGDNADAISGASGYVFDPNDLSGEYVVLINNDLHARKGTIPIWVDFFQGKDIPVVLDDLSCLVARGDPIGQDYASICQARLPENQMKIRQENGLLVASKAQHGQFDVVILSRELADVYALQQIGANETVTMVEVS